MNLVNNHWDKFNNIDHLKGNSFKNTLHIHYYCCNINSFTSNNYGNIYHKHKELMEGMMNSMTICTVNYQLYMWYIYILYRKNKDLDIINKFHYPYNIIVDKSLYISIDLSTFLLCKKYNYCMLLNTFCMVLNIFYTDLYHLYWLENTDSHMLIYIQELWDSNSKDLKYMFNIK